MKPTWDNITSAMQRYQSKEGKLDKLIREADVHEALMKFRQAIAFFRKLVSKEVGTTWEKLHPLLEAKDKSASSNLNDVLLKKFHISIKDWNAMTSMAQTGNDVAHPTFTNIDEIQKLLKHLPEKDRSLMQTLTSNLIDKWGAQDEIVERKHKSPRK